ncbi:MAG: CU044_2847 family protein [Chloroflexota bacterium]
MSKYVEFLLEGGGTILIEAEDENKTTGGFVRSGAGDAAKEAVEQAKQSFDASIENVRKSANLLVTKLRDLSEPPDEMDVTFRLKASGELGNIAVGKAGAEANYIVTLKWKKEQKEGEGKEEKETGKKK